MKLTMPPKQLKFKKLIIKILEQNLPKNVY